MEMLHLYHLLLYPEQADRDPVIAGVWQQHGRLASGPLIGLEIKVK